MNIPMRWGRAATRFAVGIRNRGRERAGNVPTESPQWWVEVARVSARRSQKRRRIAARRAAR